MNYRKAADNGIITDKNIIHACDEINRWNQHEPSSEYFKFVGIGTEEEPEWTFNWDSVMGVEEDYPAGTPEHDIPRQYMECGSEAIVVAGIVWEYREGQGDYEEVAHISDFEETADGWTCDFTPKSPMHIQEVYLHFNDEGDELATGVYIVS